MKINETWIKYDVIIYTPSVCMGVSFDVPNYFDKIYAYGCHQSLGSQEFAQMLHRVRTPKTKEIILAIDKYKPYDKAGSYGIQDGFSVYVEKINGCFYNVMGFPISRFYKFYKTIAKGNPLID